MSRYQWPRHRDQLLKAATTIARKSTDRAAFVRKALELVACRNAGAERMAADELGDLWDQIHGSRHQGPPTPESVQTLLQQAQALADRNQFGQAAGLFHAAFNLSTFPETGHLMAQAASGLVHTLIANKEMAEAEHFARQLQAAAPGAAVPLSLMAQVRSAQERYEEALALFQEVLGKTTEQPSAHLHTEIGLLQLQLGRMAEAETSARRAVELEASNPAALKGLGLVLLRAQRWDEAQRYLEIAQSLDASDKQLEVLLKIARERHPVAGSGGTET